jgi:Ca2+-binding EF-hand superfamily protein
MGCCCSSEKQAREDTEVEARQSRGAKGYPVGSDAFSSSSHARVQAWREEAGEAEDDVAWQRGDNARDIDGQVGGLDEERAGKFVSAASKAAMRRAFKDAVHSGKYRFEKDKENALSARRLGENHPQARGNPLAGRILATFSAKRDGGVREEDWIAACVVLHPDGSYANKARAGFEAYDYDRDGIVSEADLIQTLRTILGEGVSERQVFSLVDQLKKKFDKNGDGVLEEKEFRSLLTAEDVKQRFTMDLYGNNP